jgi:hypothetical protein
MLGTGGDDAARARATVKLAEALGRGVTRDEFGELRKLTEEDGRSAPLEGLAVGAGFWAQLKEAGFSTVALGVVAETVRRDYRASDVAALARNMAARREDLATPARLNALRDAVRRGERPERLVPARDAAGAAERPRTDVPQRPTTDRPERPAR